jgi:serine/threonine-protein kinase
LLDFGIAKPLDGNNETGLTATRSQPMTREYAAPEQVLGEPITTATDVYALGVLMYELLSGHLPYARAERGESSWPKAIVDEQPQPFTRALSHTSAISATRRRPDDDASSALAAARGTSISVLIRQLRGDLERIVQRALEKAPEARYASVTALADDLRAWLEGRPLPGGSRRYRLVKFLRRHRAGAITAAICAALALAGIAGIVYQARETQRQAQTVTAVKDFLLSCSTPAVRTKPRARNSACVNCSIAAMRRSSTGSLHNRSCVRSCRLCSAGSISSLDITRKHSRCSKRP